MEKSLNVLLIEDLPDDAALMELELRKAGFETACKRVETEKALRDALDNHHWDIIISDYNLPGFDGLSALEIVKESGCDIPFIIVSGTVGEETAVEAVLAGAHDYVMKDNLRRIPVAVRREIGSWKLREEKRNADQKIRESLEEKEVMLKEIHHRVKNNLAVISALLTLQSDYVKDIEAKELFYESVGRIKTMALIHEKLYQTEMFASIEMGEYIHQLVASIQETYLEKNNQIRFDLECDKTTLDITRAIPCGLIINELLTNACKHAFKGKKTGVVTLKLKKSSNSDECLLEVSDNGTGIPDVALTKGNGSLGITIIRGLAGQLNANLNISGGDGTRAVLAFKV